MSIIANGTWLLKWTKDFESPFSTIICLRHVSVKPGRVPSTLTEKDECGVKKGQKLWEFLVKNDFYTVISFV